MTLAVPTELSLNGKEFRMSPLTERDSEELNEWVRAAYIRQARLSLDENELFAPAGERVMAIAMTGAMTLNWYRSPGIQLVFASKRGLARLIFQGCRKQHPAETIDSLLDCLATQKDVIEARETFIRLNGLTAVNKEGEATSKTDPI